MPGAYIVAGVRSAGGKKNGKLSGYHSIDLGAAVLDGLVERAGIDGGKIDDVIIGCLSQVGSQGGNIGRNIVLASQKVPEHVPGTVCDRQCGSSLQAFHFAAQAVMSGTNDVVVAGGVESMSQVPIGAGVMDGIKAGHGNPFPESILNKYGERAQKGYGKYGLEAFGFSQFGGADMMADKYGLTRKDLDDFAVASHAKAVAAKDRMREEILPLPVIKDGEKTSEMHVDDEGVRPGTAADKLAKLNTMHPQGFHTPGTSSQICDGASMMLVCNEEGLKKLGVKPLAKVVSLAVCGDDPVIMLNGPVPATEKALKQAKMKLSDIDLYEVNEAFASVPLGWAKALGADLNKLNVNGGAMALGHPIGGTGTKLMTTLVHELCRRKGKYGILAICEGGGTANATIIENCQPPAAKL
jgi:acetyl-CoA C-acetyltransferase